MADNARTEAGGEERPERMRAELGEVHVIKCVCHGPCTHCDHKFNRCLPSGHCPNCGHPLNVSFLNGGRHG